ncbi:response regulator [Alishewanella longhuensis]|uniref:Response regulator n=1 Tax=Alishewanella longhuensis TaxID=1091037 RepID=A0ABQ3KVP1_9ALTE|nr:response regulator [Alishewanella longhuensis]GHG64432.1 response regulator [Alishewanella longhuensis]
MTPAILICDDSNLARKQLARILPQEWQPTIFFAGHGADALETLKKRAIDWLFLDLNMPVMDGYQVLTELQKLQLPVRVIVVSGDIQPEAYERVMAMGALTFLKKPVSATELSVFLQTTVPEKQQTLAQTRQHKIPDVVQLDAELRDVFQEVANVAMGQAGDLLARLLNVFVKLPIPNVNLIEVSELTMALASIEPESKTSAICQGFIGSGVAGEALLILTDSSFQDIARLLNYHGELNSAVELELLMDVSNILIGAVLKGIAEQVDMTFSQGHPVVLGQHAPISELIKANAKRWRTTLTIELSYGIESFNINCDLLLLFTEDSLKTLRYKLAFLMDEA